MTVRDSVEGTRRIVPRKEWAFTPDRTRVAPYFPYLRLLFSALAKQKGGIIKLANVPAQASQTLRVTGVLRLFEVFESEAAALKTF